MWPDRRIQNLLGVALPIVQAPMAGAVRADLAVAVAQTRGAGVAALRAAQARRDPG